VFIPNRPFQPLLNTGFTFNSLIIQPIASLNFAENTSFLSSSVTSNININAESLLIEPGGSIDLTNNHMILDYAPGTQAAADNLVRDYLTNGVNFNGPAILSSAGEPGYGLGYADGADGIVPLLPSGEIDVAYTLLGDANLERLVTGDDYTIMVEHLPPGHGNTWDQGDFLYTGAVTGDDFTALVQNLGHEAVKAAVELPSSDFAADGLIADVPEPASLGVAALAGVVLLPRRRRLRC
jgi:hypothetical protein